MRRSIPFLFSVGFSLLLGTFILAGAATAQLEHFNVYNSIGQVPPPPFQPVTVTDQFGELVTGLGPPTLFLVPAQKNDEPFIDPLSHLTRYDATGPSPGIGVSLADQFQQQSVTVLDPFLFCNPVDKNGEGIQNPDDHLACYLTQPPGPALGLQVPIMNQFSAAPIDIFLEDQFAFCLPSAKRLPPAIPAISARGLVIAVGLIAILSMGAWRWRSRAPGRFGAQ